MAAVAAALRAITHGGLGRPRRGPLNVVAQLIAVADNGRLRRLPVFANRRVGQVVARLKAASLRPPHSADLGRAVVRRHHRARANPSDFCNNLRAKSKRFWAKRAKVRREGKRGE